MLRVDEARDYRRRLGVGLVAGDRRAATLAGGDDAEPHVRERGDGAGRPPHRHGRRPVQDHEGGRATLHRLRAVPWQVRPGDQEHHTADTRGTP